MDTCVPSGCWAVSPSAPHSVTSLGGCRANQDDRPAFIAPSKTGCFARGVAVGAGGALLVAGAAVGAVALGAPAAVVTGALLLAGGIGGGLTAASTYNDIRSGNYAGAAYNVGSVVGGVTVGGAVGGAVGDSINPPATRGWSIGGDWANRFSPSLGSVGSWLGTGPDATAAGGSIAGAASKVASFLRGPC
jgi:hypothetical protein